MAIKSDRWIRQMSLEAGMITPFVDRQVRSGAISYGLSSYGYDVRVADEFKVFTNVHNAIVDPKAFDARAFVDIKTDVLVLPPNSFALARSVEYIKMPRTVTGLCTCKSTYVRSGIAVPSTVLEAGWEGEIVIEIANHTNLPARVYANEGIMQILFFEGDEDCEVAYGERSSGAKYQGQTGITLSRV